MRSLVAAIKLFAFFLLTFLIVPAQMLVMLFCKGEKAYLMPQLWHWGVCKILRISYEIEGQPTGNAQTIFMVNHLSYLDIPLLGSFLKHSSFVAKKEVAGWMLFGFLSKLQQTFFIERRRGAMKNESDKLRGIAANQSKNLIIFPEGTSTDGIEVRDFKSGLFMLAVDNDNPDLLIQPVTICLIQVDGKIPNTIEERRVYTWPVEDSIELSHHLWRFARSRGACLKLVFHDPLLARDYQDRKTLAKLCHDSVSKGLQI